MELTFITSNKNKAAEFKALIGGQIEIIDLEYPELRYNEPCDISKTAAKTLADRIGKTVIVEDSGLFIEALKGFPGTSTKYITNRIGNKGIIKLMEGIKNRKCFYESAIGYCEPGKEPLCFVGKEEGKIAEMEKGKNGWGNDFIFIPKGKSKTYSEIKKQGETGKFRIDAINNLKAFLSSGNHR